MTRLHLRTRACRVAIAAGAAALAGALAAGPAAAQPRDATLDSMPREIVPAETLATFPPGTFLENLLFAPDGSLLITSYFERQVLLWRAGRVDTALQLDVHPVSLAPDVDGTLYFVAHGKSFRSGPDFVKTNQVWRWREGAAPEPWIEAPQAQFMNGIARVAPGVFLVADSLAGAIWRVDVGRRAVERWLAHAELESTAPQQLRPGANGIRTSAKSVVVSNSTRRSLIEIALRDDGGAGALRVRAVDVPTDDFAIAEDGTVFSATHRDQIVRIRPDGTRHVVAEHVAVKGSTSAVFGVTAQDRDAIYVVNDGGLFFGAKEPPALVRLRVGVPGPAR